MRLQANLLYVVCASTTPSLLCSHHRLPERSAAVHEVRSPWWLQ